MREFTDALVILSMLVLIYVAIADWGGLPVLERILGTQLQTPSFLYFAGVALVIFSVCRIADQRRGQKKRLAAEQYDPLTQLRTAADSRAI